MTKPSNNQHEVITDVIIAGGGMVGMAAAIALSQLNLKIVLIENVLTKDDFHPSYDDRTLVVNRASIRFWKNIGIWHKLSNITTAIKSVHVSNKGFFGSVKFDAKSFDIKALAHVVEAKKLGLALKNLVDSNKNIKLICPAKVSTFISSEELISVKYVINDESHEIKSKLMLAADGIQSNIRKQLKLETIIKSYNRTAIICNITPEKKHKNCAFERLTSTGPTALLPFVDNRCGFVWTVENDRAEGLLSLTDEEFLVRAQAQFGYRLGKFDKVGKRSSYPLYLVTVPQQVKSRVILMGNAAHGMSPISAQGLNLAVRDVAHLADVMQQAIYENIDIGSNHVLDKYQDSVALDQTQTMSYTDDLMGWFRINSPVVNTLRSVGLVALNQFKSAKFELFSRASGYRGKTPALLRHK